MKRRTGYLILVLMLVISMIAASGCGVDTSALAGNASKAINTEENAEAAATSAEDDSASKAEASETQKAGSAVKYDQSKFISTIPEWKDKPYCEVNGNVPDFAADEIWTSTQESLDPLDSLGRCGTANSCIGIDGMPDQPRGNISEIHPSGWHSDSYDNVEGGKLYNRCHLIAHKLSGDDAVARNLITGTSYMNRQGMLPFEDQIEEYVKSTRNHVMYRVTPCFAGDELVARGVHMQAISVEDKGKGLAFNVYCYNVQPGIEIDYLTGDNKLEGEAKEPEDAKQLDESAGAADQAEENTEAADARVITVVLNTNKDRKRIHLPDESCTKDIKPENYAEWTGTEDELEEYARKNGYVPCGRCDPDKKLGLDLPDRNKR